MKAEEGYLARSVANQQNSLKNSWQETYQDRPVQTETPLNGKIVHNESAIVFSTGLATIIVVTFVGILFKRLQPSKAQKEPLIDRIDSKCIRQASCHRCRFFNQNSYLKCAVHPSTVLTSQAKNCSDYWPEHQKEFFYH